MDRPEETAVEELKNPELATGVEHPKRRRSSISAGLTMPPSQAQQRSPRESRTFQFIALKRIAAGGTESPTDGQRLKVAKGMLYFSPMTTEAQFG